MRKRPLKLITGTAVLLTIDLLSKYFFYDLHGGTKIGFIQPSFNLGIARSIPIHPLIIIGISLMAVILFSILYQRKYINTTIACLLIAGTLGNLLDRILLGGVRDFINIHLFNFPIFNFADTFLNIGIILFLIKEFRA